MKVRHALLGITAAAALISAVANGAPAGSTGFSGLKNGMPLSVASAPDEEMVSRLIVKHRTQRSDKLNATLRAFDGRGLAGAENLTMTVMRPMSGNAHVVNLNQAVKLSEAQAIAAQLMHDSDVEFAEPDRIMQVTTTRTPTDPDYSSLQWHYFPPDSVNKGGANLPNAWYMTIGDPSVKVAVLDTGYRQHADLATVLPGYDFISNSTVANDGNGRDADPQDPGDLCSTDANPKSSWHGTHVAGTIAAQMDNGTGGTGIAPLAKILPVRVIGKCGGLTSDIADGMRWAAGIHVAGVPDNTTPAQVLNMSLGATGACSSTFQSAVNDVVGAGKVIVVAAGNGSSPALSQPANCTGVIAVTAHAIDGDNANYANIGVETAISAPGGGCGTMSSGCNALVSANGPGVYSLSNTGTNAPVADGYSKLQGTSMAAPHVSGVVALMLSLNSSLTLAQIKSYLQSSARPHPAGTTCTQSRFTGLCGEGLLDAEGALIKVNELAPIVSLTNAYQVVAPNAVVPLSSVDTVAPGTGRSINTYAWSQQTGANVGAIGGANTANATFSAPVSGIYSFKLTVTDSNGKIGAATATVRVNAAPVLSAVADQTVIAGQALNFTVGATDPEGDAVTYSADSLPASATLNQTTGAFNWPSAAPAGSYVLTYHASDTGGVNSATGTVRITVTAPVSSGGGGGSLDGESLLGLALLATCMRMRRAFKIRRN
ncbi:MAG: hypothetical protein JWQ21_188 [Herminiimonas sp.]|nr:hypothetical protein [Herminiimonas sp.]